jgi:hypothetical protein
VMMSQEWSDGDKEMSGWLHVPAALPPGKEQRYPLGRRMEEPESLCECFLA